MSLDKRSKVVQTDISLLYDISVIGQQWQMPSLHNGVYRVIEVVGRYLTRELGANCTLCAPTDDSRFGAAEFYRNDSDYNRANFPGARPYSVLQHWVNEANRRIEKAGTVTGRTTWRGVRKLAGDFNASLLKPRFRSFDARSIERANVFHSPYYGIPAALRNQRHLRKFLTVYDLIPVKYPEYFTSEPGTDHDVKKAIDQLTLDDYVVCISEATKKDLCDYRSDLNSANVFVTPLGASETFRPCTDETRVRETRMKYGIPEGRYILSLCTIEPRKNLDQLIRSFNQLILQEHLADVYLVLVGSLGWKYEKLMAQISESAPNVREKIILTGRVADADLDAVYTGASVFAYPSLYEGFGLPPLEAMQCGVPVVTSNVSSLPEVVGDAGLMVSPSDVDQLCNALLRVLNDDSLRESMSARSLQQSRRFSWEKCAQATLQAYRTAISNPAC